MKDMVRFVSQILLLSVMTLFALVLLIGITFFGDYTGVEFFIWIAVLTMDVYLIYNLFKNTEKQWSKPE